MTVFDTSFPADSVEFCPHPDAQNVFACGTYHLELPTALPGTNNARTQRRKGKCLIFETLNGEDRGKLQQIQEICLPAVLDIKWCHMSPSAPAILAIADSEGNVSLAEWQIQEKQLETVHTISCASSDILCLSLDWSSRRYQTGDLGSLVVSMSNGCLSLLQPRDRCGLFISDTWLAHDHEPWIAAWNYWDTNVIYSGGDDLKMKGWDVRQGFSSPTFVNKRFEAGVTTIQSHVHVEHIIAVGTYDNTVRLFDTRNPLLPISQADIGGGAWRVKWHPSAIRKNDLLVACMHDGFKIVRFDLEEMIKDRWEVIKRYDAHESLAYGVDWSFATTVNGDSDTVIASCSFYDHALHIWSG